MALALSGLTVSKRLRSRRGIVPTAPGDSRSYSLIKFWADISWTNTSDENHWVEVKVTGRDDGDNYLTTPATAVVTRITSTPKDSTIAARVLLCTWRARNVVGLDLTRDIDIEVKATNGTTSSTPLTTTLTITLANSNTPVSPYYTAAGDLVLPACPSGEMAYSSGERMTKSVYVYPTTDQIVVYAPAAVGTDFAETGWVLIEPIGVTPKILGTKNRLFIQGIPPFTEKLPASFLAQYLNDGGFYSVRVQWPTPKALTADDVGYWSTGHYWKYNDDANVVVNTFNTNIEFWKNPKPAPVITSNLFVKASVGVPWKYNIRAQGAASYDSDLITLALTGASDEAVNEETGEISALFDATAIGDHVIEISATNEVGTTTRELTLSVVDFDAEDAAFTFATNKFSYGVLRASAPDVTWAFTSGDLPPGMQVSFGVQVTPDVFQHDYVIPGERLNVWAIQGTPTLKGSYTFVATATKAGTLTTDTATITVSVSATGGGIGNETELTVIVAPSNGNVYTSAEPMLTGEQLRIGLISDPAEAEWAAAGLPPGITIDEETGLIEGTLSAPGRYSALVTAKAIGYKTSLPLLLVVSVDENPTPGSSTRGDADRAVRRLPWLAAEWKYTDIQILARSRKVESTLQGEGGVRLKAGDDYNFLIFFIDSNNAAFDVLPESLKLTIREANNLDEPLVLETDDAPEALGVFPDPCFLLTSDDASRSEMKDIVEGWVANATKAGTPTDKNTLLLPCVGDVEWTVDGQLFSSDPFPIFVELDVTR